MDIVRKIREAQETKGWSDKELAEKMGVSEYLVYKIKAYRQYVTKPGYYVFCGVLGIPHVEEEDLEYLLEMNRQKVGPPDTNLELAVTVASPEYVERLERELASKLDDTKRLVEYQEYVIAMELKVEQLEKKCLVLERVEDERQRREATEKYRV